METNKTPSEAGRWVRTLEGYKAFRPHPLPPEITWTPRLVRILSQADSLLGRLAGEGRRLPNPHVLIRPFIRREAVYSSRIEGTQVTLGELLAAEAGAIPERSPEDLREVGNYVTALEHGLKRLKTLPLSLRLVRELPPFLDGNGRVGRLLITLSLCARSVLPEPLLYLSAFFEATRADYYDSLRGVTEKGDWAGWIEYFLNGVARQSEDALSRAERINQQLARWRDDFAGGGSKVPLQLIDLIAANPFLGPRDTERRLSVSYNTVMRAIEALERGGVVSKVGDSKRDRVFCARAILDILEEPARLVPEAIAPRRRSTRS